MTVDDDSAWKDILDTRLKEFLEFFFPQIHADVEWARGYEFLDKELDPILRDAPRVRVPTDAGHLFRSKPATFSSGLGIA